MKSITRILENAIIRIIVSLVLLALTIVASAEFAPQPQSQTIEIPTEVRTVFVQSAKGFQILVL